MPQDRKTLYAGDLVTNAPDITVDELCEACRLSVEQVSIYVKEGIVQPQGPKRSKWRFSYSSVITVRRAKRLETELGLNTAGVALALDLLDQIEDLKRRLARFDTRPE